VTPRRSRRFAALHRFNGAVYFGTLTVSTVGTFMQSFAQAWLVLTITGNRTALPFTIALQTLPLLFFGTVGGTITDRFDNRRLLLATSVVNAGSAFALGVLSSRATVSVGVVYVFSVLGGFVTVIERPATQAYLSQIVAPSEITAAVGLNSMIFPFARLAGPPLASLAISTGGLAWCFHLNAVSYMVFVVGLVSLRTNQLQKRTRSVSRQGMAAAGLRYARDDAVVSQVLLVMLFVGFAGFNFLAVIPMMGKFTFHLSERGLVLPMAASAIGSLAAGALAAGVEQPGRRLQAITAVAFGGLLVAYGTAPTTLLWTAISFPVGVAATLFQTFTSATLQRVSRPDMLGRVLALNSIAFIGTTPLGMVFVTVLTRSFGARGPFVAGGTVVAVAGASSAAFLIRKHHWTDDQP
jgi:predicted MFS family arabinose efflux permease